MRSADHRTILEVVSGAGYYERSRVVAVVDFVNDPDIAPSGPQSRLSTATDRSQIENPFERRSLEANRLSCRL